MCLLVVHMTLNPFTSLWLSTTAKQNELISLRLRTVHKQLCKASVTILMATLVTIGRGGLVGELGSLLGG